MTYKSITHKTKNIICDRYKSGTFIKQIAIDTNVSRIHINRILKNAGIEIVNYAKRITPSNAFKKGQKPHNKGLMLEDQYGTKKANNIKKKIGARTLGKTWAETFGDNLEDVKNKMNKTRYKNKDKTSKVRSNSTRKNWINGVYDGCEHKFYNVKWYDYNRNNTNVRLQGTWEVEMAKKLDELNIDWICHSEIEKRFKYIGLDKETHSYKPDFQIVGTNIYIDPHWDFSDKQQNKFDTVIKEYSIDLRLPRSLDEIKQFNLKSKEI